MRYITALTASLLIITAARAEDAPVWVGPMRDVHAKFKGEHGTVALFGDSITVSLAFWTPLSYGPKEMSPAMAEAVERVKKYQKPECWREWRGPEFGNNGRMTIRWAHENIVAWLKKLNPEAAVILFGTNDLNELTRDEFTAKTREVIERCLRNGTVVILTTLPPRHGFVKKADEFAAAVRVIAREMQVPLIDFHAEVLKRRPDDWDGAMDKFKDPTGKLGAYEVPTLIARDGVHPSNPKDFQDYSARSLDTNGFVLRNYLTVIAYDEVIRRVLNSER